MPKEAVCMASYERNASRLPARRKEPIDLIVSVVQWANKAVQSQLQLLRGRYCTSYERLFSYREALGDSMVIQDNEDHTWTIQESFRGIKQMAIYTVSGGNDDPLCTCGVPMPRIFKDSGSTNEYTNEPDFAVACDYSFTIRAT